MTVFRKLILSIFLAFSAASPALAQAPELSADQPIEFDAGKKVLIATGNATFIDRETIVVADQIRYFQDEERILAEGNVQITRAGLRLVADRVSYNLETRRFESDSFRAGSPPMFAEGSAFEGVPDEIQFRDVTVYYGEPDASGVKLRANTVDFVRDERLRGDDVRLRLGVLPSVPAPDFDYELGTAAAALSGNVGYRDSLGAFVRSEILYPIDARWRVGGNLDLYSKRGVLIGPSVQFKTLREDSGGLTTLDLSTGWIYDTDDELRGEDYLERPINENRYFALIGARHREGNLRATLSTTLLNDPEVLRDFRPDIFRENQQPDSFAEVSYLAEDVLFSVFARVNPNDGYGMVERLPELRLDRTPGPLGETGAYQSWHVSLLQYRDTEIIDPQTVADAPAYFPSVTDVTGASLLDHDPLASIIDYESDWISRADVGYSLRRPVRLSSWAALTPVAGVRALYYDQSIATNSFDGSRSLTDDSISRWIAEVGADLTLRAHGDFKVESKSWDIHGLRHILEPVIQYRWQPAGGDDVGEVPLVESLAYLPGPPVIDLMENRAIDAFDEGHRVRFGLQNRLLTNGKRSGPRELLEVNLFQDLDLDASNGQDAWNGSYVQLRSSPAPWLALELDQKFRTEEIELEHTRLRIRLVSAEKWQMVFGADYFEAAVEQYNVEGIYWVTPYFAFVGGLRYDAELDSLTRQRYGVRQRIGNAWQIEYSVGFTDGASREDDWDVGVRVYLLEF